MHIIAQFPIIPIIEFMWISAIQFTSSFSAAIVFVVEFWLFEFKHVLKFSQLVRFKLFQNFDK